MEFCGRCGYALSRQPERGRFCASCGHETRGSARYPLYADGTPAVTRPRPASVSQTSGGTTVRRLPERPSAGMMDTRVAARSEGTRRRPLLVLDAATARPTEAAPRSTTSGSLAIAAALIGMLLVVVLGLVLLLS